MLDIKPYFSWTNVIEINRTKNKKHLRIYCMRGNEDKDGYESEKKTFCVNENNNKKIYIQSKYKNNKKNELI